MDKAGLQSLHLFRQDVECQSGGLGASQPNFKPYLYLFLIV